MTAELDHERVGVLGVECRLVFQAEPAGRAVAAEHARDGDCVSLADGFPLLVAGAASLAALNAGLGWAAPMGRFRPNLVVAGGAAWAEDGWGALEMAGARLRLASPCVRCKVITLDQETGETPVRMEPLRTLGRMRRTDDGAVTFGWNAIPERVGVVRVGDAVAVAGPGTAPAASLQR